MARGNLPPADLFVKALEEHAPGFGVRLDDERLGLFSEYYAAVGEWNPRLHLVAPCTPGEFATRHVLESLAALSHLAEGARLIDVGSGAGLPAIPCLVARSDLRATLVEASAKKGVFLKEALRRVGRADAAQVVVERFERLPPPEADALTCRALERFSETIPALARWAGRIPRLLLFGGDAVREALEREGLTFEAVPLPESQRRFLFVVSRA
jgi:16S rRNA (guanine527-N7)-methyltransferase